MKASIARAAVFVAGLAAIVGGVALLSVAAAFIVGGSLLVVAAYILEAESMRPRARRGGAS